MIEVRDLKKQFGNIAAVDGANAEDNADNTQDVHAPTSCAIPGPMDSSGNT